MGITNTNREKTDPEKLVGGMTIREYFAGQFAGSGGYTPRECVIRTDDLIHFLNVEDPTDYIANPAGKLG